MRKTFTLAAVLTLRTQAEGAEERALSAAHADAQATRAAISQLARQMMQHSQDRAAEAEAVFSAAHHQATASHWRYLRERGLALHQQLDLLEKRVEEQTGRFIAAKRSREVLTELHEKYEKSQALADEKAERARIDDLFSARYTSRD